MQTRPMSTAPAGRDHPGLHGLAGRLWRFAAGLHRATGAPRKPAQGHGRSRLPGRVQQPCRHAVPAGLEKNRLHLQFESDRQNRFLPLALSLAGLGQRGLRDRFEALRDGVIDEALAYYAGALQQRTLSATQMRQILQDYLAVPVRIDQFVGRWYTVPPRAAPCWAWGRAVCWASRPCWATGSGSATCACA